MMLLVPFFETVCVSVPLTKRAVTYLPVTTYLIRHMMTSHTSFAYPSFALICFRWRYPLVIRRAICPPFSHSLLPCFHPLLFCLYPLSFPTSNKTLSISTSRVISLSPLLPLPHILVFSHGINLVSFHFFYLFNEDTSIGYHPVSISSLSEVIRIIASALSLCHPSEHVI
jgi:hypothetical protein